MENPIREWVSNNSLYKPNNFIFCEFDSPL
jgi:hypothetical protein